MKYVDVVPGDLIVNRNVLFLCIKHVKNGNRNWADFSFITTVTHQTGWSYDLLEDMNNIVESQRVPGMPVLVRVLRERGAVR